ncbi:alpha/beta hydrolase [Thalassotalea sp. LPB0316]|uniref:alpha/beta hydrolase n=1 Tax=Thalassotalea sp. LPB0316 TaxID=2769490 RepID=UPI001866C737|nr:alpha/beta hydrolase [Thalassotalea sp. LPB0316]QOL26860.1 alpha/beta hydrolase [Thalassotalea sp. LPB0316]
MKKIWKSLFSFGLLFSISGVSIAEESSHSALKVEDCHVDGIRSKVRCGTLTVPENYQQPNESQLDVHFVIIPALDNSKQLTPLMFLAGGPGQAAAQMAGNIRQMFSEVLKTRDIIVVDQRGTGQSNGLQCSNMEDFKLYEDLHGDMSEQDMLDCRANFTVDLAHYSTPNAIRDFDNIRAALGWNKLSLYGGSYGTRAALVYMNMFPESLEAVVLDSVGPVEVPIGLFGQSVARSYNLLLENCQLDANCKQAFPNLDEEFQALFARVEAEPVRVDMMHPTLGTPTQFVIDRAKLISTLRLQLYSIQGRQFVPLVIHQAYLGNYLPLAGLLAQTSGDNPGEIHAGLLFNILCNEDYPRVKQNQWSEDAKNSFGRDEAQKNWHLACTNWPKFDYEAQYFEPVTANIPTLILSGKLDPVTPPSNGDFSDKSLPNSRHIVVKNASHIVVTSECAIDLVDQFLTDKDPQAIDETCLTEIADETFITNLNGNS